MAGGGGGATGIRGRVTPFSASNVVNLRRDGVVIQQLGPGGSTYDFEDTLPLDGTTYTYDFYESRLGYADSTDSADVTGKPTTLSGPGA
jgi:hypothetical protein